MKFFITIVAIFALVTSLFAQSPVSFSGDFRFRHQTTLMTNQTSIGSEALRFRLNAEAVADSYFTVSARLVTGTTNPLSNESPVMFGKSNIWIDRIFITAHYKNAVKIYGGKMPNPFIYTPMHFDPDLNFDGFAAQLQDKHLFANAGGFWINESTVPANQGLLAGQLGANIGHATAAVGYYHYINLKEHPLLYNVSNSFGNTSSNGVYAYEYNIVDANMTYQLSRILFAGNYMHNTAAKEKNVAWLAGAEGNLKYVTLGAYYCDMQADALVGALTDDEPGGGTDLKGYLVTAYLTPSKNTRAGAKYYYSTILPGTASEFLDRRVLLDFELKFN